MRKISEEKTRKEMINPQLEQAGWIDILYYCLYRENRENGEFLKQGYPPDYKDLVARQIETYVTQHNYNADQIRFLRAVQSMLLQKRHLETTDLYEPPLDMFGADAVERWFTEKEVDEIVEFSRRLVI